MRLCALSCEVFVRECSRAVAYSPHIVDLKFLPFGLHDQPEELRARLQQEIDCIPSEKYEYIVLAYGLCSRGTAGLFAREVPIVVPRAHDCITLLLGSRCRYEQEFTHHPGTYYFSSGWIERKEGEIVQGGYDPIKERLMIERLEEYIEKYGEDNARYLIEQEQQWLHHYDRAALIQTGLGDVEGYRDFTRRIADQRGWVYEELNGDTRLLDNLLSGKWNDSEFLLVQPGGKTVEDVNEGIITACYE